jgi:hypothetical protein
VIDRRTLLAGTGAVLLAAPPAGEAQQVRADQHIRCRILPPGTCRQYRAPRRVMWSGVSAG